MSILGKRDILMLGIFIWCGIKKIYSRVDMLGRYVSLYAGNKRIKNRLKINS